MVTSNGMSEWDLGSGSVGCASAPESIFHLVEHNHGLKFILAAEMLLFRVFVDVLQTVLCAQKITLEDSVIAAVAVKERRE